MANTEELDARWISDGKLFRKKANAFHLKNPPEAPYAKANRDCKIAELDVRLRALETILITHGIVDRDELTAGMCHLLEDEIERIDRLLTDTESPPKV
jgi:hypothetical protein